MGKCRQLPVGVIVGWRGDIALLIADVGGPLSSARACLQVKSSHYINNRKPITGSLSKVLSRLAVER